MISLKQLLAMKPTMNTCRIIDGLTNTLYDSGKKGEAAFFNLIATEIWVRVKAKKFKTMKEIYLNNKDVRFNEANGYNVINPYQNEGQ